MLIILKLFIIFIDIFTDLSIFNYVMTCYLLYNNYVANQLQNNIQ